jgi:hypothetical protein
MILKSILKALQAEPLLKSISDTLNLTNPKECLHSFLHLVTNKFFKAIAVESLVEKLRGRAGKTEMRKW